MSNDENVDLVRHGYELFRSNDVQGLLNTFDENIEWRSPGPPDLPTSGVRRGRQEVKQWLQDLRGVFDIERLEPHTFVAQGDRVVVLGTDTSRVRATGKTLVDEPWAHAFTVKGDKVVRFEEYRDTSAVAAELEAANQQ